MIRCACQIPYVLREAAFCSYWGYCKPDVWGGVSCKVSSGDLLCCVATGSTAHCVLCKQGQAIGKLCLELKVAWSAEL